MEKEKERAKSFIEKPSKGGENSSNPTFRRSVFVGQVGKSSLVFLNGCSCNKHKDIISLNYAVSANFGEYNISISIVNDQANSQ